MMQMKINETLCPDYGKKKQCHTVHIKIAAGLGERRGVCLPFQPSPQPVRQPSERTTALPAPPLFLTSVHPLHAPLSEKQIVV